MYDPILNIVLHQPEIPQNTGNIGRSCVAAGAKLWLVRPLGFRLDQKHLRRAGMDYWDQLHWEAVDDWQHMVPHLQPARCWYLTKWAERPYTEAVYQPHDWIVLGSESAGLPRHFWEATPDQALRIPMRAGIRSLNLGSAAAIVLFEALRQLNWHPQATP